MASDAVDEAQLTPGAILRGVGIAAGATTDVPALIVQNIVGFPTASDDVPPYALAGDKPKKLTKPNITGKEGAKDVPSWARGERPNVGESGKDFADRLVGAKYGKGYKKGVGADWSKIKKWADRSFIDPSEG